MFLLLFTNVELSFSRTTAVADQRAVWALYSELVQVIKKSGLEEHKNANVPVVEELSYYPSVEKVSKRVGLPNIVRPVLPVKHRANRSEHVL